MTIKCETHCHVGGCSPCATASPAEIAAAYEGAGYGAVCVTNHYMQYILEDFFPAGSMRDKVLHYISFYERVREECANRNIRVFFGLELNPAAVNAVPEHPIQEFLCYGVTRELLLDTPKLYLLSQKEMFALFGGTGGFMCQAHPFRGYCTRGNPLYMHGAEVFNERLAVKGEYESAVRFAEQNNLKKLSGSDFHDADSKIRGGIYLPDSVKTEGELAAYLLQNQPELLLPTD